MSDYFEYLTSKFEDIFRNADMSATDISNALVLLQKDYGRNEATIRENERERCIEAVEKVSSVTTIELEDQYPDGWEIAPETHYEDCKRKATEAIKALEDKEDD